MENILGDRSHNDGPDRIPSRVYELLDKANEARLRGDFESEEKHLRLALDLSTPSLSMEFDVTTVLSRLLFSQGRFVEAYRLLGTDQMKSYALDARPWEYLLASAIVGQLESDEVCLLQAEIDQPAWFNRGVRMSRGDRSEILATGWILVAHHSSATNKERSIAFMKAALQLQPNHVYANTIVGTWAYQNGDLVASREHIERAILHGDDRSSRSARAVLGALDRRK